METRISQQIRAIWWAIPGDADVRRLEIERLAVAAEELENKLNLAMESIGDFKELLTSIVHDYKKEGDIDWETLIFTLRHMGVSV